MLKLVQRLRRKKMVWSNCRSFQFLVNNHNRERPNFLCHFQSSEKKYLKRFQASVKFQEANELDNQVCVVNLLLIYSDNKNVMLTVTSMKLLNLINNSFVARTAKVESFCRLFNFFLFPISLTHTLGLLSVRLLCRTFQSFFCTNLNVAHQKQFQLTLKCFQFALVAFSIWTIKYFLLVPRSLCMCLYVRLSMCD